VSSTPIEPGDILPIIKRRKAALIIPAVTIMSICLVLAFYLPSYYRSSATILIEEQEIPQDFVMATVTSFAEQRLEMIKQRIMSHTNLLELINKHELYSDLRSKKTTEEIVDTMRENIQVNTISAEIMDRRTGRATAAMIAFQLTYEGKDPRKVMVTTNALSSLFLEENLKERTRKTEETTQFLEDEMNKVKVVLTELHGKISVFKEKNMIKLPEFMNVNVQLIESTEKNQDQLNEQLKILAEKEKYFITQLSMLSPEVEFNSDQRRLEELKVHLVALKSRFSDEYPDVINTKSEIQKLTKQLESVKTSSDSRRRHPDNPAYITITSQLSGLRSEIDSVKRQILEAKRKKSGYESRIESSAQIEGEYKALLSEQANMDSKLNDLTQKHMEAKVASGLEKDQKGERFTLIDPPRLPEKPFKPNRIVIIVIGFVLSMGISIGIVAVLEFLNDSIYKPSALVKATKIPVLGEISVIRNKHDLERIRSRRQALAMGAVIAPVVVLLVFHFLIMDLNVFWAKLLRKLV
jgi:polysaccharide chain length determinant protein (PEP-CTERM system associated)